MGVFSFERRILNQKSFDLKRSLATMHEVFKSTDILPLQLGLSPAEVAARCTGLPGLVFFDTALKPSSGILEGRAQESLSLIAARPSEIFTGRTEQDWADLRTKLRAKIDARQVSGNCDGSIPTGFAAGWVEYDGSFSFGFYDGLLAYRHQTGEWFSVGDPGLPVYWPKPSRAKEPRPGGVALCFSPALRREEFIAKVLRAQEYIAGGDIYQVNLTHRFSSPWEPGGDLFGFYTALRQSSPAPYAALLSLNGRDVLSSSPELFLKISGRRIRTRPIKGTRPRRHDPLADEKSARELVTSAKEAAELVMITDLERNDLGQVCKFGSVRVSEMLHLERYEQVFHLVSTVEGELRPEVDAVSALQACFPGGSITGAPKKRAREIIAELETVPRGLYTGAIGYFGFNGESQFNIAIRTVVIEEGEAHFHVGAGIVADSQPAQEWQETLDKAAGILLAAERFRAAKDI